MAFLQQILFVPVGIALLFTSSLCINLEDRIVQIGIILPRNSSYLYSLSTIVPAVRIGIESVKQRQLLPDWDMTINFRDSMCSDTIGPLQAIDLYHYDQATVFLGPACSYAMAPIARFSHHWQIPLLSVGMEDAFRNKEEYRCLTSIMSPYQYCGQALLAIAERFSWESLGLLYFDYHNRHLLGQSRCSFIAESIAVLYTDKYKKQLWSKKFDGHQYGDDLFNFDPTQMLTEASQNVRIIIMCASPKSVREIMLEANRLGYTNGEYIFFNIDLFGSKSQMEQPWIDSTDTAAGNEQAEQAFKSLMTITSKKPNAEHFIQFSEDVKQKARDEFNMDYGDEEMSSFVGAFNDAVLLYALAVNESIEAGGSITNGTEITRRMWNRTFSGMNKLTVWLDRDGTYYFSYPLHSC